MHTMNTASVRPDPRPRRGRVRVAGGRGAAGPARAWVLGPCGLVLAGGLLGMGCAAPGPRNTSTRPWNQPTEWEVNDGWFTWGTRSASDLERPPGRHYP